MLKHDDGTPVYGTRSDWHWRKLEDAIAAPHDPAPTDSTARRQGAWVATGTATVALAVYLATLAPGLTAAHSGADGGDLIAAARTLGVPHPPGYPTYVMLAWLFTQLPVGTVAFRTNLMSALCAAATVGLICRVAQLILPAERYRLLSATAASLTLAFSALLWSQAVISEVYALLGLFSALEIWLLVRWRCGGGDLFLWLAALGLGVGLGNHLTLVFLVPASLFLLWPQRRRWLRARVLLPALALFLAGLGVYAYLPLAAAQRPPVNWGDPRVWNRFVWMVTAKQYQPFVFGLPPEMMPGRLANWAGLLGDQFGWWGLALAVLGIWTWWAYDRAFALFSLVWVLLAGIYAFFYNAGDSYVYLVAVVLLMALWLARGAQYIVNLAARLRSTLKWAAIALIVALPLSSLGLHWKAMDLSGDRSAQLYASEVLGQVPSGGLVIVRRDRPTFALWYAVYAEKQRPDVAIISGPLLAYIWYRDQIRHLYPDLTLPRPHSDDVTIHDLVREVVTSNQGRREIYATDPREEWEVWFDFEPVLESELYRVVPKSLDESDG